VFTDVFVLESPKEHKTFKFLIYYASNSLQLFRWSIFSVALKYNETSNLVRRLLSDNEINSSETLINQININSQ